VHAQTGRHPLNPCFAAQRAIALHTCWHRSSSFNEIGLFTCASQFRGGRTGHSVGNALSSEAVDILAHGLLGRHCSGRSHDSIVPTGLPDGSCGLTQHFRAGLRSAVPLGRGGGGVIGRNPLATEERQAAVRRLQDMALAFLRPVTAAAARLDVGQTA
jgi:hypothetical protein